VAECCSPAARPLDFVYLRSARAKCGDRKPISVEDTIAARGPHVQQYLSKQVMQRLGGAPPSFTVNFVQPPARDGQGNLVTQLSPSTP
jgi:hypothetical protein